MGGLPDEIALKGPGGRRWTAYPALMPRGAMVVQDDANPIKEYEQNFKIVSWADIEATLGLPQD